MGLHRVGQDLSDLAAAADNWNGTQFKIYELFISGIFHLFLDYGWPMVLRDDLEG